MRMMLLGKQEKFMKILLFPGFDFYIPICYKRLTFYFI